MVMVAGGERGSRASAGTVSLRPWPFHSYPSPVTSVTVVLATMSAPLMGAGGGGSANTLSIHSIIYTNINIIYEVLHKFNECFFCYIELRSCFRWNIGPKYFTFNVSNEINIISYLICLFNERG